MPRYIGPLSGKGGTADQNKQADPLPSATRGATRSGKKENASWADGRTFSECDRADKAEEEEEEVKKLPPAVHTFTAFSNNPKGKQIVTTDISLYVQRRNLWRSTGTLKEELLTKLKVGEEYDGYIVKTKASDYDYGTKMWAQGRVAPPDPFYPKDGEEYDALVIDRIGNNMLLGVGPHIAFASKEAFRKAGLNTDTLKLPYGCIKVNLHPVCSSTRPKDLLIAAWTADLKPEPAKYSHVLNF